MNRIVIAVIASIVVVLIVFLIRGFLGSETDEVAHRRGVVPANRTSEESGSDAQRHQEVPPVEPTPEETTTRPDAESRPIDESEADIIVRVIDGRDRPVAGLRVTAAMMAEWSEGVFPWGGVDPSWTDDDGVARFVVPRTLEEDFNQLCIAVEVVGAARVERRLDLPIARPTHVEIRLDGVAWFLVTMLIEASAIRTDDATLLLNSIADAPTRQTQHQIPPGGSLRVPVTPGIDVRAELYWLSERFHPQQENPVLTPASADLESPLCFDIKERSRMVALRIIPPPGIEVPGVEVRSRSRSSVNGESDGLPEAIYASSRVGRDGVATVPIPRVLARLHGEWTIVVEPSGNFEEAAGVDWDLGLRGVLEWTPALADSDTPIDIPLKFEAAHRHRRLMDRSGRPVAGARVGLVYEIENEDWQAASFSDVVTSSRSGDVYFKKSPDEGTFKALVIRARGFRTTVHPLELDSSDDEVIVLDDAGMIDVRLKPAPEVRLDDFDARFLPDEGLDRHEGYPHDTSERGWSWTVGVDVAGEVIVKSKWDAHSTDRPPSFVFKRRIAFSDGNRSVSIELDVLESLTTTTIHVIGADGKRLPQAWCRLPKGWTESRPTVHKNGDITFLTALSHGTCEIGAEGYRTRTIEGPLSDGDFILEPGLRLLVRPANAGEMLAKPYSRLIGVTLKDSHQWIASAPLGVDGTATLFLPGPGSYRLAAYGLSSTDARTPASFRSTSLRSDPFVVTSGGQVYEGTIPYLW